MKNQEITDGHLPDDKTRDLAKRMHFAAFRWQRGVTGRETRVWRSRYFELRDRIVLGNRKLIFRAVNTRVRDRQFAEECAAECHIVMIRAVAGYNPWLGIRFSTFAYTCLLRELSRMVRRQSLDRLRAATTFDDALFKEELAGKPLEIDLDCTDVRLRQYFASDHPLLDEREKLVLSQRFGVNRNGSSATLAEIGDTLRLSKERVRQVQISALDKLRNVFVDA